MIVNGFILKNKATQATISKWRTTPSRIDLPNGDIVLGATGVWNNANYEIVSGSWEEPDPPDMSAEIARQATITSSSDRVDLLNRLKTATAAQIDTWVDNNVTTLAQARTVLKAIIKVIALDVRN